MPQVVPQKHVKILTNQ